MRILFLAIATLLLLTPAQAKDVMLVLNDQEREALKHALDVATKSAGMEIAPLTVYLLNKLNAAPTVVEHTDGKPAEKDAPQ